MLTSIYLFYERERMSSLSLFLLTLPLILSMAPCNFNVSPTRHRCFSVDYAVCAFKLYHIIHAPISLCRSKSRLPLGNERK
ncbi:hypothetical protein BKA66DRAFT_461601 [Pyrenochaeta sp. MPI-SDFR-AT-0127]|nr:hypothetical protein BKA66DRAFT_461601 [Pyrenochaeta sp. MPI-SDFR-AT-0127]